MEQSYRKRPKGQKNKGRENYSVQNKSKTRKKGRAKSSAISGFSTLSEVSGAPLYHHYHSSIPVLPQKSVMEPDIRCTICGERIDSITSSFHYLDGYAHFDCVLSSLREREHLEDGETISYLGSGSFGICRKNEDGKYTIVKRIEVENKDTFQDTKNYVESLKQ